VISAAEAHKDTVQELTESAAGRVASIATIVAVAVRDVTTEVGGWVSDIFEMREAAKRATQDK
jgi:Flp pilus assembly pilin Flp